jgi:hypothetical protein
MYSITMLLLMLLLSIVLLASWQLLLLLLLLLQSCNAKLPCLAIPCCMQLRTTKALLLLLLLLRLASRNTFQVCCLTASLCTSLSCSSCCCTSKISHISCCCPTAATFCYILHGCITLCLGLSLFTCEAANCPAGTPS